MSSKDAVSKHYAALSWARQTHLSICNGEVTFQTTDDNGNVRDVTAEIRDQQQDIIEILEALNIEDRRQHPRS